MCSMSMKLPGMFDQNPIHTFDKIVEKGNNKNPLKLDLESRSLQKSKDNDLGNKKHATQKIFEQGVP